MDLESTMPKGSEEDRLCIEALESSSAHPLHPFLLKKKKHLLYITESNPSLASRGKELVEQALKFVQKHGLATFQIEAVPKSGWEGDEHVQSSFKGLCELLSMNPERTDVIVCRQAAPHRDVPFEGELFRSAVLHTGNESGYFVGCVSEPQKRPMGKSEGLDSIRTDLHVKVGDVFLLNPQHIHLAIPLEFAPDNLLVLLQEYIEDETPEQREATYLKYPPEKALHSMKSDSFMHF